MLVRASLLLMILGLLISCGKEVSINQNDRLALRISKFNSETKFKNICEDGTYEFKQVERYFEDLKYIQVDCWNVNTISNERSYTKLKNFYILLLFI